MTRSDNVLPFMWEAYSLIVEIIQKPTSPSSFHWSLFLKPYFQWEGLNIKLNKRNIHITCTVWVPDHSIHHPMHTPTNGEGRGCMMGCSKGRQVRDTEQHTNSSSPNSLQMLHYCIQENGILTTNEIQIVWFKTQNKQTKQSSIVQQMKASYLISFSI